MESAGGGLTVSGDTTTIRINDSLAATLITHGDTLRRVDLSPAANRATARALAGLNRVVAAAWWQFVLIGALIYLPIPMGLAVLTLVWAIQRGSSRHLTSA